jgi:hypothetical protein
MVLMSIECSRGHGAAAAPEAGELLVRWIVWPQDDTATVSRSSGKTRVRTLRKWRR